MRFGWRDTYTSAKQPGYFKQSFFCLYNNPKLQNKKKGLQLQAPDITS
jgi:hypothetical protein